MVKMVIELVSVPGKITLRLLHLAPLHVRWHKFGAGHGAGQNLIEDTCKSIHITNLNADLTHVLPTLHIHVWGPIQKYGY